MSGTDENLKNAFAGESQANRRYIAFARKADDESYPQIAKLFRAAAEADSHALNHLRVSGGVKSTAANLETALSGETFEFQKMYPEYVKMAGSEGNKQAGWSFDVANKVEQIHAGFYSKAIEAVRSKKDLERIDYYVCSVCGNTVEGKAPEKCPICGAPKDRFSRIT